MTTSTTAIADTVPVATSTGSMGASHTGLGVYEYGFSMHGNTLGVSTLRELFLYTPWGFPEHGGFPASYTGSPLPLLKLVKKKDGHHPCHKFRKSSGPPLDKFLDPLLKRLCLPII